MLYIYYESAIEAILPRLLHRWLSLVSVVYKVQRYPLSLVSVFGFKGDNQRSLNDRLPSLSNLKSRLSKSASGDSGLG